jgi:imidazolonepropionase-like amidohydrolase
MAGELSPAAAREKKRLEDAYANPSRLVASGVTVALTSGGGEGDLRKGVARAIQYGLSEAEALAAVTTTPATLLGIPGVIRLGQGMAATFVVADGPLFEEETGIRYTFVEGELERGGPAQEGGIR